MATSALSESTTVSQVRVPLSAGTVWFSAFRTSCTWYENPTIGNTDDDPYAEIVMGSNSNCAVRCPATDPIHPGIRCVDNSDCLSGTCTGGFCHCSNDAQCPEFYTCTLAGLQAEVAATLPAGLTPCRAAHPAGVGLQGSAP